MDAHSLNALTIFVDDYIQHEVNQWNKRLTTGYHLRLPIDKRAIESLIDHPAYNRSAMSPEELADYRYHAKALLQNLSSPQFTRFLVTSAIKFGRERGFTSTLHLNTTDPQGDYYEILIRRDMKAAS